MTLTSLSRALRRLRPHSGASLQAHALHELAADRPIYAIGDIHGCLGLLQNLLAVIEADAARIGAHAQVLLLGDMMDRGENSAGVLDLVMRLAAQGRVLPILGNHERMMLQFLEDPRRHASWLEHGGFETLMSYGLAMDQAKLQALSQRRLMQTIDAYLPQTLRPWLEALPLGYHVQNAAGTVVFAHAGLSAAHGLSHQPEDALLWGTDAAVPEGHVLVHGHFICAAPGIVGNRIEIDTGAWKTGRLTAVRLWQEDEPQFLTVQDQRIIRPSRLGAIT